MSYRIDMSHLTLDDLDEVAALLAGGTPEPAVARRVDELTYRNLLAAAGGIHPAIGSDVEDQRPDLAHAGAAGETYGR